MFNCNLVTDIQGFVDIITNIIFTILQVFYHVTSQSVVSSATQHPDIESVYIFDVGISVNFSSRMI